MFVDDIATRDFLGGIGIQNKLDVSKKASKGRYENVLLKAGASAKYRSVVNKIMLVMKNIKNQTTSDDDYMYVLYPYMYATSKGVILEEYIKSDQHISKDLKKALLMLLGVTDE